MKSATRKFIRNLAVLISPLLVFPLLLIPYSWLNQEFLVVWFGCGCPKFNVDGTVIFPDFNANDFTTIFWSVISVGVAILAFFLSRKVIAKEDGFYRLMYMLGIILASVWICVVHCQMLMWC